jgi:methylenetetrahydrofolate--tRNA-(uracil-5-)-methyltransferase
MNAALKMKGRDIPPVPYATAHGALIRHIIESDRRHFQPSNINFGLFPSSGPLEKMRDKKLKKARIAELARAAWKSYLAQVDPA